jgi:hypothetical protein
VVATDAYGQTGQASTPITVDAVGPKKPKLGSTPRKTTASSRAKFTFKSSERRVTFECALDKKKFHRCTSPEKVKVKRARPKPKKHKFSVRAVDALGNVGKTTSYGWKVVKKK